MTERIDHASEALACELAALSVWRRNDMPPHMEVVMQLDLARLHAQLALVEQQRIANIIALHRHEVKYDIGGWSRLYDGEELKPTIREALGIEPNEPSP